MPVMPVSAPTWTPLHENVASALGSLMWMEQFELNHRLLMIYGMVKPSGSATSEMQAANHLWSQLGEILDVLDQAGIELAHFPDVQVSNDGAGISMRIRLEIWDFT